MKKTILIALGLLLLLSACDRKAFVKKLVGTYTLDKYLFDGQTSTYAFDTAYRKWKLQLSDDEKYLKTWTTYYIYRDSLFVTDTLGYDTLLIPPYITRQDTFRFWDTVITDHVENGKWDLINSEEDLQLRSPGLQSGDSVRDIYRILELTSKNLILRKGNEELYLKK